MNFFATFQVGFASLVFLHAIYLIYKWHSPHRFYPLGVPGKGHKAFLIVVEAEAIAALINIVTSAFNVGWRIGLLEQGLAAVVTILLIAYALATVWNRDTLNRSAYFKRLVAPTVLGVLVSLPALFRFGRRLGDIVFAQ